VGIYEAENYLLGTKDWINYNCKDAEGAAVPCINNICVLTYDDKVALGTSLNIDIYEDTFDPNRKFTDLLEGVNNCNDAMPGIQTGIYGNYHQCDTGDSGSWYNKKTKSIIYSKDQQLTGIGDLTLWQNIMFFIRNPITFILNMVRNMAPQHPAGYDFEYLENANNFNKIYLAKKGEKSIKGVIDEYASLDERSFSIDYSCINSDICATAEIYNQQKLGASTILDCQYHNNNAYLQLTSVLIGGGAAAERALGFAMWSELTAKTRLLDDSIIPDNKPTAKIISPENNSILRSNVVEFQAHAEGCNKPLTYSWDFNNDGIYEYEDITSPNVNYILKRGNSNITLTVRDVNNDESNTSISISVNELNLGCYVVKKDDCDGAALFRMASPVQSLAALMTAPAAGYDYVLCCNGSSGLSGDCGVGLTTLQLSSTTDAKAELPSEPNYNNPICLSSTSPDVTIDECISIDGECPDYYTCILSISDATDAYVGSCTAYTKKICCKIEDSSACTPNEGEECDVLGNMCVNGIFDCDGINCIEQIGINKPEGDSCGLNRECDGLGFCCVNTYENICAVVDDPCKTHNISCEGICINNPDQTTLNIPLNTLCTRTEVPSGKCNGLGFCCVTDTGSACTDAKDEDCIITGTRNCTGGCDFVLEPDGTLCSSSPSGAGVCDDGICTDVDADTLFASSVSNGYDSEGLAILESASYLVGGSIGSNSFIAKLSSDGITESIKQAGQGLIRDIYPTADNKYIAVGKVSSLGSSSGFIAKLDSSLNIDWKKKISNIDVLYSVKQASNGDYLLAGKRLEHSGDGYAAILDSNGNSKKLLYFGNLNVDFLKDSTEMSTGYLFVGNLDYNSVGKVIMLLKLNKEGTFVKSVKLDLSGADVCSVEQFEDGYIVIGSTSTYLFAIKVNEGLDIQWTKKIAGQAATCQSAAKTADQGFIISGDSANDIFLFKLNRTIGLEWARKIDTTSTDHVHSVSQTSDYGYVLTGSTTGYNPISLPPS
ncbi:MAG: PKD domain-containing protein, partial [Nanoarchaeota archaeon]